MYISKNRFLKLSIILAFGLILSSATIDLNHLFNYANQDIPDYVIQDNSGNNPINNKTATLGRVLFYDKKLSSNGSIACASCHIQEHAFGDPNVQSQGVNGLTGRHSMRLVNARFSNENSFFWDERAETLEEQTTQPLRDHIEMGFSGTNGDPTFDDLINYLQSIDYYNTLFEFAYGDSQITENRIQLALAQFIRSIQSFDSRFDQGLVLVNYANEPFPNFTSQENRGKDLFLNIGCADCHIPSGFALHISSFNNGVITVAGMPGEIDITNIRAPSLRDLAKPDGTLNGPFMHDGSFATLLEVINHYNHIPNNPENTNLDTRLRDPNGEPQQLNLTEGEKHDLVAFLKTLGGSDIYINEKWSNPFEPDGSIKIIEEGLTIYEERTTPTISIFPNPIINTATIETNLGEFKLSIYSITGSLLFEKEAFSRTEIDLTSLSKGLYFVILSIDNDMQITKHVFKK